MGECQEKLQESGADWRMATQPHHDPRPLIDPIQMEEAGRALRHWIDRLLGHAEPQVNTDIDWEDGEPHDEQRDGTYPGH